ncbi:MAG: molybdopterin molybdotransferase MoeA [Chthoniobacterales bacterium]
MISEKEARTRILAEVSSLPGRAVLIADSLGRFAAQDYVAEISLPVFDNSAMDGYAVKAADARCGKRLRVIGEQPAGQDRHLRISSGEAIRIFTGAPVPLSADAVVMQEEVTATENEIVVNVDVDPGEFVRRRGCDLSEGQKILSKGERLRPVNLALLASQGLSEIAIGGEASVSILSTGDELARPGEPLPPGQIYESNSTLLRALAQRCGAKVNSVEHCRDDRASLIGAIRSATADLSVCGRDARNHVLIITGGVSVGKHDLVKTALQSLGAKIDIWRVAIKPGKPFLFGRMARSGPSPLATASSSIGEQSSPWRGEADDCFIFGLPGNPVSAFVTFLRFVQPAILKMMGAGEHELEPQMIPAELTLELHNDGDRAHYVRGKFERGKFEPVGRQESHALFGLSQANALLRLAPEEEVKRGAVVQVQLF